MTFTEARTERNSVPERPFPTRRFVVWVTGIVVLCALLTVGDVRRRHREHDQIAARLEQCEPVSPAVADAIAAKVDRDGKELRNWLAVRDKQSGRWLVSAERIKPSLARGAKGQVLTWSAADPQAPAAVYRSADAFAAKYSGWPVVEDQFTAAAGHDSRFCVVRARDGKWHDEIYGSDKGGTR